MYESLPKKQLESLRYRWERLDAQFQRLEGLLSGGGKSLRPLVRTESGVHWERGVWRLIDQLLEALEAAEARKLPEKERALFSSFLYCAIRVAEEDPWWITRTSGTFSDILRLGKSLWTRSKVELCYMEVYGVIWGLEGFFGHMDELYRLFSGQHIKKTFSEAERQWIRAFNPEESAAIEKKWRESEELEELLPGLDEDPEAPAAYDEDEAQREWEAQTDWVASFADKEVLCRQYLRFRGLYFDEAGLRFPQRLRRMLDVYLAGQGVSAYLDDDAFFETYAQLDEIARRLRGALSGEG